MPHMEGIFINGEKAKFHPEDILDTDASQYTEEIGESVTAYLGEHLTNPTNPPIDTSLSIAGAAADAKKTGDELESLKSELEVTSSYNITWSQGGINNSGVAVSRTNRIRTDYITIENDSIFVEIPSGFKYSIHAYNASKTRIGYIPDGSDIMTDRKATYKVSESYANAVYFRMWVAYVDDSNILPTEGDNVTVVPYESVVDTLKSHVLKSVRILGVGNSYTRDSIRWLCKILKESGYEDVIVGHGYLGASTLAEQYASLDSSDSNHSAFEYWKYSNNKNAVKTSGKTLDEIFTDEPWDIVVFQQQSDESGQYASYVSLSFDINDFITYIAGKVSNANLKFALMMPWSHADGYTSTKFAEYYNSDPETMLDAIKTVIPQVADHMSQCDYVVNAGEAIDLGRQNSYLNALGDQMLRTDKNHLYYGIPSYMVGLVYALTLCDVNPNNVMWYPTETDEGQTDITTSGYLAYLAKQCAFTAVNGYALADDINAKSEQIATNTADITELKSDLIPITGINKSLTPTKISGLNFVKNTTNYVSGNNYETFYIPVKSGYKYVWTSGKKASNPALRFVFAEDVPANGVTGTYLGEQFVYDTPVVYNYVASADGYLSISVWVNQTDTDLMSVSETYTGRINEVSASLRTVKANIEETICVGTTQRSIVVEPDIIARKIAYYTGDASPSTWPGGLAVYKNKAFIGYHSGYMGIFDISAGAYLGYTRAPQTGSHMNTLFFDYSIFHGGYPLLYVSYCYADNSDCYVYAIGEENGSYTLSLIQKIKYTGSHLVSGDSIDWCFDSDQICLIALIGTYSGTNKILRFSKPEIGASDVTLADTDILSVVTTSVSFTTRQSPAVNNGNMFVLDGTSNGTLYVIDTITGSTINSFALAPIDSHEPEGISIYDRKVYINFHVGSNVISANLYELTF